MSPPATRERRASELVLWIVPLAALLAIQGVGLLQSDPVAIVESRYLALLTAGVLAALSALVRAGKTTATALTWTAILAVSSAWLAYQGPSRGAAVSAILVGGMMAALMSAVRFPGPVWTLSTTVPAAIGLQLLLRGDLLLPPLLDIRTLVSLLVLPAIAGGALSMLASIFGDRRATLAAAATVILAPGFNVTTTASLAALAAGGLLAQRDLPTTRILSIARGAAVVLLLALTLWNRPLGALLALTGLSLWSRGRTAILLPVAGLAISWFTTTDIDWSTALERWIAVLTVVPAWILIFLDRQRSNGIATDPWMRWAHGALFMAFAAKVSSGPDALAAGLALIALAIPPRGSGVEIQRRLSLLLVSGTALLATYPWTRQTPHEDVLALLGNEAGLVDGMRHGALVLCGALIVLVGLGALLGRSFTSRREGVLATAVVVLVGVAALAPGWARSEVLVDSFRAVTLGPERLNWRKPFSGRPVRALVLDTHLIHGIELAPNATIAILRLRDRDKQPVSVWRIRAGVHTAEWASARPDIANRPDFVAPPHWIARLSPAGDFFSRLFRARFVLEEPLEAESVTIQVAPGLPSDVRLVVNRLEIRW